MNQDTNQMWTKQQLREEMTKARWEPGTVDGIFVHRETGKHIDINARDSSGAIIWLTHCLNHVTPTPF